MSDSESIAGTDSPFVYLGFVDTPVKESDELSIEDTFIGGEPKWLHNDSVPADELLICGACKSRDSMRLILQAFSPLDCDQVEDVQRKNDIQNMNHIDAEDDRVLYVFMCMKCQKKAKSVRCIRGVRKGKRVANVSEKISEKTEYSTVQKNSEVNPFDVSHSVDANPFNSNPFQSNGAAHPFTQVKAGEDKQDRKESVKTARKLHDALKDKEFDNQKAFKSYLLYVEEESFKNKKPEHLQLPKNLKIDKDALDLDSEVDFDKNPIKLDPRTEKLSKFLDDDVFQKFQEIVAYNPSQVLRYDLGGTPLLYAKCTPNLVTTVPRPGYNPSSKRIYEVQLMPKMIMDLEESVTLTGGMQWGTIMIFTDIENYMPKYDKNGVGYVEEFVKVQWESEN
ncbi:hypothetical protein HG535_0C04470 [Zygotorulaspora mrakii]|uniref:Programmed cell death protein 2 C-terminal domain-containing protein n=1 Tax=Zygotorulaspora mrakii TaxID=42260 RepID=A0A7H9B0Q4_ZYGMR|nr:uncharacterized protein HG535_0C04470 [Zygotorulaspora mrakii]QLG72093.1 hypothetical protein HG535_0C04470 [Zygotorulaspora mrakii]